MALEPGAVARLIAGDGDRHAVAAYALRREAAGRPGPVCRLALIDLEGASVERALPVCAGERDAVQALALERGPDGPTAYVALWREASPGAGPGGGRLAAVHLPTGAVRASAPLPGVPEQLLVAPAPDGPPRRLYAVTAMPSAEASQDGAVGAEALAAEATEWRLTGFDPATLHVESEQRLPFPRSGSASPRTAVAPSRWPAPPACSRRAPCCGSICSAGARRCCAPPRGG